jgi:hypothetical protein
MASDPWDRRGGLSRKGEKFSGSSVQFEVKKRPKIQDTRKERRAFAC